MPIRRVVEVKKANSIKALCFQAFAVAFTMTLWMASMPQSWAAETYYQILGVPENATQEEIQRAYRRVISRTHPDLFAHASQEEKDALQARTQQINLARDVLTDQTKRSKYDAELRIQGPKHPGVEAYEKAECLRRNLKASLDIHI